MNRQNIVEHHFDKSTKNKIPFYHGGTKGRSRLALVFLSAGKFFIYLSPNLSAETGEGIALRKTGANQFHAQRSSWIFDSAFPPR